MHYAAETVQLKLAELFLSHNAYVTLKDNNGRTALMIAEEKGHADVAALLKQKKW